MCTYVDAKNQILAQLILETKLTRYLTENCTCQGKPDLTHLK